MTAPSYPEPASTTDTARLETFSDGVFAIAITLLVLDLRVPSLEDAAAAGGLTRALVREWPMLMAYAVSFGTIGITWINHHAIFQYVRRADRTLLLLHVAFLCLISFVPFPTAMLAEQLLVPDARSATILYGLLFTLIAIAFNAIWWYSVRDAKLLGVGVHEQGLRTISARYRIGPLSYALATAAAMVSVPLSLAAFVLLALLFALPDRKADGRTGSHKLRAQK